MKRTKKALAVLLSLVLLLSAGTIAAFAASYGAQGTGGNTLTMLTPSDITVKSADTDAYYSNVINTSFDPAADVTFTFTMGSGMNNFNETLFKTTNLPLISVVASYGGSAVATPAYVSGSSAGITISAGKLAAGTYTLVFGKTVQGNNADKTLGKDIAFEFTVKAGAAPETGAFTDVPDWAKDYVAAVVANGCMKGVTDTTFNPDTVLTRGEFVTILGQARGIKPANFADSAFSDVAATDACSPYAAWAAGKNITNGIGGGNFGPNDTLTREQVVTMLYRYAAAFSLDTASTGSVASFTDNGQISSWAAAAMAWAVGHNYVSGIGGNLLAPGSGITRAQAAKLIAVFVLAK
jgi:hypothetical protein